jgi:hypothetical protein
VSHRAPAKFAVALPRLFAALLIAGAAHAQGGAGAAAPDARSRAPVDLTGYWVAVVTEDWRYRMMTPDKGDFTGIALNGAGRALMQKWDPARDQVNGEECRGYGAAAIMRLPTRLHITWQDGSTLKVDTDAGEQTRLLHFTASAPHDATPTWQGYSAADWEGLKGRGGFGGVTAGLPTTAGLAGGARAPTQDGYLKVLTTQVRPGYLRKNGVPYGAGTAVEEYFDSFREPNGDTWLVVTSIVNDPEFLDQPFITSSQFKKTDAAKWNPTPCQAK